MINNRGIAFKLTFFILTSCIVIFIIIFGYNYSFSRRVIIDKIEENADTLAVSTVNKIETILSSVKKVPAQIANSLEHTSYNKENLLNMLETVVDANPEIYGATIAFEPYAFDESALYFAPYFYKNNGEVSFTYLGGEAYHYFNWEWYKLPKTLGVPVWSEPYYDKGGGNIVMATYSVPFYKDVSGKKIFTGIVTADISLAWLQEIVASIKIGKTGYGFLISKKGTIVTYPDRDLIMNETIFSLAEDQNNEALNEIGNEMISGQSGFKSFLNSLNNERMWIFYSPIPSSGWSLGIVISQKELMADVMRLNAVVVWLGLAGLVFLFLVIFFISRSITKPLRGLVEATKEIAAGKMDFYVPKVKFHDEVGKLTEAFTYMKSALKRYIKQLTETTAVKERIESELKIAHDIQMEIVPKDFSIFSQEKTLDVYAILEPAKEVGGDFYDFFLIDKDHFCFVIADISGKGVPAALFMAVAKTLIKTAAKEIKDPAKTIGRLNKEFAQNNNTGIFITVFCGILNLRTGEIVYVNAGHNAPLVVRKDSSAEFLKNGINTVVGIEEKEEYVNEKILMKEEDMLYVYTDGVTEAFNRNGKMFSEEKLKYEAEKKAWTSSRELAENTLEEIKNFSFGVPQSDDITILVFKFLKMKETNEKQRNK
ncbi:MAG: SpoIIE family protein phosphatase [Candidatus Omnitrophota bacterium]